MWLQGGRELTGYWANSIVHVGRTVGGDAGLFQNRLLTVTEQGSGKDDFLVVLARVASAVPPFPE